MTFHRSKKWKLQLGQAHSTARQHEQVESVTKGFEGRKLGRGCQFIAAVRPPGRYTDADKCGRSTTDGTWCAEHRARVYVTVKAEEAA